MRNQCEQSKYGRRVHLSGDKKKTLLSTCGVVGMYVRSLWFNEKRSVCGIN